MSTSNRLEGSEGAVDVESDGDLLWMAELAEHLGGSLSEPPAGSAGEKIHREE